MKKNYNYMRRPIKRNPSLSYRIRYALTETGYALVDYLRSLRAPLLMTCALILAIVLGITLISRNNRNSHEPIVLSAVPTAEITVTEVESAPAASFIDFTPVASAEEAISSETAQVVEEPEVVETLETTEASQEFAPVQWVELVVPAEPEPNALVYSDKGDFRPYVNWYKPDVELIQQALAYYGFYSGKIDGDLGEGTGRAIVAFQKAKGLTADGICGPNTLRKMKIYDRMTYPKAMYRYTPNLEEAAKKSSSKYMIEICYNNSELFGGDGKPVMILYQKENGYWRLVKQVYCTPGKNGATPIGVFSAKRKGGAFTKDDGKTYWKTPTWFYDEKRPTKEDPRHVACFGIHSTGYNTETGKYNNSVLGTRVSAGCVRVHPDVASWIYNNCPKGTTIVVDER